LKKEGKEVKYKTTFFAEDDEILNVLRTNIHSDEMKELKIVLTLNVNGEVTLESEHIGFTHEYDHYEGMFSEKDRLGLELALLYAAKNVQDRMRLNEQTLEKAIREAVIRGMEARK
jgi:hypothetical protein